MPRLQSTRRGPQVVLACLVVAAIFLLVPQSAYPVLTWNATRAHEEPPPAVRRIMNAAGQHQPAHGTRRIDDLLVTVGYLAQREFGYR